MSKPDMQQSERDRVLRLITSRDQVAMAEDGYYAWWPVEFGGFLESHVLRWIADHLDSMNKDWDMQCKRDPAVNSTSAPPQSALVDGFIVELEQGCWLDSGDGDPPRTTVKSNAMVFATRNEAFEALKSARRFRPFRHAQILVVSQHTDETDIAELVGLIAQHHRGDQEEFRAAVRALNEIVFGSEG